MIADERHGDTAPRSAIDYIPGYSRYSDRIEEDEEEEEEVETTRTGRIEEGNRKPNHALPGNVLDDQETGVENEWARN